MYYTSNRMKNVVIYGVYTVGMHHWSSRELEIGTPYYCHREPGNPYDNNAVAVFKDASYHHKSAYIRREDAEKLAPVFQYVRGSFYLKAKDRPTKFGRRGPMQRCNVGFKTNDSNIELVKQELKQCFHLKIF